MKRRIAAICLTVALGLGCGGSSDSTSPGGNNNGNTSGSGANVTMTGLQFSPATLTVSPGTTVTWTNHDNTAHNVTFTSSAVTSIGDFATGSKTATMPQQTGSYAYHCTIHAGMNGTIVVQ